MSSQIWPSQALTPAPPTAPTDATSPLGVPARAARVDRPAAAQAAIAVQTLPSSPPAEVLAQMAQAARTHTELQSQGRELRFVRDEQSGRTRVEVRDRAGNVLKTLSPAQALDVAAGGPL